MDRYKVEVGFRKDGGMVSAVSTHFETLTVLACSEGQAGHLAIDAIYQREDCCSHVFVRGVQKLTAD